jgi:hypothetical protein
MNDLRHASPLHALIVYAALGVAIGMVVWALFVHDGSGSGESAKKQQTLHTGETK